MRSSSFRGPHGSAGETPQAPGHAPPPPAARRGAHPLAAAALLILGLAMVGEASATVTCRNNTTGARACSTDNTCPVGWSIISTVCSTRTVGGSITYVHDHGIGIKCTWENFQGDWAASPGDAENPVSVTHAVEGVGNSAICSGWEFGCDPSDPNRLCNDGVPVAQDPFAPFPHAQAPFGFGQFSFRLTYSSTEVTDCIEDPDAGLGNNCDKQDADNPKHGGGKGSGGSPSPGASLACMNTNPGTVLTYMFNCAAGTDVTGGLTLVPAVGGTPQPAPAFTGPCSAQRVAAGACTLQMGGLPTKTVKVKGQPVVVVDAAACLAAFPGGPVVNALNSGQPQELDPNQLLFYQEIATQGQCDPETNLPTVPGEPATAYGVACQSNLGPFDGAFPDPSADGFDDELRVCALGPDGEPHTTAHDVEIFALQDEVTLTQSAQSLNLGCSNADELQVRITDQQLLRAADVSLAPAPVLIPQGAVAVAAVSPDPSRTNLTSDSSGKQTLRLFYPTCRQNAPDLVDSILASYPGLKDGDTVTLRLVGEKVGSAVAFIGSIDVKAVHVPN